jgi:flagellar biosynthesis chaperone FliJ
MGRGGGGGGRHAGSSTSRHTPWLTVGRIQHGTETFFQVGGPQGKIFQTEGAAHRAANLWPLPPAPPPEPTKQEKYREQVKASPQAEEAAQVERKLRDLEAKRDSLRSVIADSGISAADRRKFFDSQGRLRSNTADDQRADEAFENARRATALSRSDGDPNSIRAEMEQAETAARKLRHVQTQIRELKRTTSAGTKQGEAAVEYVEAARQAEFYGQAVEEAAAAKAAADARVAQLERRAEWLGTAATDPMRDANRQGRADVLFAAANEQLRDAWERAFTASAALTRIEAEQAVGLDVFKSAEEAFARTQATGTRTSTPAAAAPQLQPTKRPRREGKLPAPPKEAPSGGRPRAHG